MLKGGREGEGRRDRRREGEGGRREGEWVRKGGEREKEREGGTSLLVHGGGSGLLILKKILLKKYFRPILDKLDEMKKEHSELKLRIDQKK